MPLLIKIGPLELSSFGVALMLAFLFGAFQTWKVARDRGLLDEKILDNLIVVGLLSFIGSRFWFVLTHWDIFSPNLLRIVILWKFPGFALWGALLFGIVSFIIYTRHQKLPLAVMFDAYGSALPIISFFISLGVLLDGSILGKETNWIIGILAVGAVGKHQPTAAYAAFLAVILAVSALFLRSRAHTHAWSKGSIGWFVLSGFGCIQLLLAFTRADLLYFEGIPIEVVLDLLLTGISTIMWVRAVDGLGHFKSALVAVKTKLNKKHDTKI